MAAGDTMQGRRLPYDATAFAPGDYRKNADGGWDVRPPRGHVGNLDGHTVVEHEDGTITVSPSILYQYGTGEVVWHGYLEHGVWREV